MLDGFGRQRHLPPGAFDDLGHGLPPVENLPRLLILIDINRNLVHQLLVHLLVLGD